MSENKITRYVQDPVLLRTIPENDRASKATLITGYASIYYNGTPETEFKLWNEIPEWGIMEAVERVLPGAFDQTIREDDVRGLFNHNPDLVLGRKSAGTLKLASDERGLSYSIPPADTTVAKDLVEHIRRGDVRGSSFSFRIPKDGERWEIEGKLQVRYLEKVQLFDVGPVTFPAYENTTAGTRIYGDPSDAKISYEYENKLRLKRELLLRSSYKARAAEIEQA